MGLEISLIVKVCITPYVVDLSSDHLGYESLHVLYDVGLHEVHLSRVYEYWLGVGFGGVI